ncbi:DUF1003 domain-containing protein [Ruania halotolerans]|uniref:DUF1003 domain-containing protein n=1 Tax=Ruania halotolerans TaxID=2897773 RepID=UPI001E2F801A|nr:DUF1003 domain-containing protein [Ruania halotolerans]UFU05579.1 DUF1003 domain-containing protein [Ruania halotolerans]
MSERLDTPLRNRRRLFPRRRNKDSFGKFAEGIARFIGTPRFLLYMTVFCGVWLGWNTLAPPSLQFDARALNFTLLTLMLSLQASYSAPLILLAQDRQTDRDRVTAEQDRQRAERNLADTEFLAREIAALRLAVNDVATRDFLRSELRSLLEEIQAEREDPSDQDVARDTPRKSEGDRRP